MEASHIIAGFDLEDKKRVHICNDLAEAKAEAKRWLGSGYFGVSIYQKVADVEIAVSLIETGNIH
jgi:hypothetical protein